MLGHSATEKKKQGFTCLATTIHEKSHQRETQIQIFNSRHVIDLRLYKVKFTV